MWPFRDAPRAYAAADAPVGGGERGKNKAKRRQSGDGKGRGGNNNDSSAAPRRAAKAWPVGGQGIYTVVACPGETAAAFIAARCPGPGW